jgi:hypothetical protein
MNADGGYERLRARKGSKSHSAQEELIGLLAEPAKPAQPE